LAIKGGLNIMTIYYSATTNAFYDSQVYNVNNIPEDKVAVSASTYNNLMAQQCAGRVIVAAADGTPTTIAQTCGSCTSTKYATKTELTNGLAAKANDSAVVHKTGDETINGVKSFGSVIKATNGTVQVGADTGYSVTFNYNGNITSKQPRGTYNIFFPEGNGTLALTSDIDGKANDSAVVHKSGNETINGVKTFSDITISNKELHYKDTKYDWTDTSLNVWCDAGHVAWFDKTGNRRMHELVGAKGGVWRKACYINENQYFSVDSNRNISFWGNTTFTNQIYLGSGGSSYGLISAKDNNSILRLFGGTSPSTGANLDLYGEELNGGFSLRARTSDKIVGLDGKTDGTLKWNGKNVALDENLVHTTGREVISGDKVFQNTIYRQADITTSTVGEVYRFSDTNATPCGAIYNRMHWHNNNVYNRHQAYNATSDKNMYFEVLSHSDGSGVVNTGGSVTDNKNLTTATSGTDVSYVATMGWVNNPATSTNVVHRSGNETINGVKSFNDMIKATNGTVQVGADTGYSVTFNYNGSITSKQTRGTYNIFLPEFDGELLGATFVKGTNTWYRKHSDGFIEMGGFTDCANAPDHMVVATNLPLAFSNTNYTLLVQLTRGTASGESWGTDYSLPTTRSKTTTRFEVYSNNLGYPGTNGGGYNWYACGY
jgi:hypothetical protein